MPIRKTGGLKVQLQITVKQAVRRASIVWVIAHFTYSRILDKWFVQNTICRMYLLWISCC